MGRGAKCSLDCRSSGGLHKWMRGRVEKGKKCGLHKGIRAGLEW